jgi:hypothetical protein
MTVWKVALDDDSGKGSQPQGLCSVSRQPRAPDDGAMGHTPLREIVTGAT